MRKIFRTLCILLTLFLVLSVNVPISYAESSKKTMTILFTHDMHDHLLPFNLVENGQVKQLGGYARLQSVINDERKTDPNLLLVDAGDFSMGTLFQTIFQSDAPELRILGQMGYDATTFGNHEFDFRASGLADSLNTAKSSGDKLPEIVASNVSFLKDKSGNMTQSLTDLKQAMSNYGVKDYTVIEKNGIKVGIFGLTGKDAASCAPMSGVTFTDEVESAKRVVNILKKEEKVDLIVCLSHSGTWTDKSKSEDEILAKKVPDINVIISGHTHTKLDKPIMVGKTIIGSCGEYGENLGTLNISQNSEGNWSLDNYKLKQIDSSLPDDSHISQVINNFKSLVQEKYLNNFGLKFDEVLAQASFNFTPLTELGKKHEENTLGDLISDSYIYAVKKAEGADYEPVAAAIVPCGTIRGSFVKGDITVSDAFNTCSLGIGPDKIPGYPLISVYLTGKELKTVCEVDASIAPIMSDAQLYMSGLNFVFNPNRLIMNKVTGAYLYSSDAGIRKIDDKKLYRVVVNLYSAQMLSVVGKKSYGLLSIVPKTKEGKPITDYEAQIIKDNKGGQVSEIKEWLALAEYLQSFSESNGVPQVPESYSSIHERKVVDNSHNIISLLSKPNGIAAAVYSIVVILIAGITFIIVRIATRKKRRAKRMAGTAAKTQ